MSKLTEILKRHIRGYRAGEDKVLFSLDTAEADILAWANEVIGEDDKIVVRGSYKKDLNNLRAEQRKRAGL